MCRRVDLIPKTRAAVVACDRDAQTYFRGGESVPAGVGVARAGGGRRVVLSGKIFDAWTAGRWRRTCIVVIGGGVSMSGRCARRNCSSSTPRRASSSPARAMTRSTGSLLIANGVPARAHRSREPIHDDARKRGVHASSCCARKKSAARSWSRRGITRAGRRRRSRISRRR